jgi:hypothetical protein
MVAHVAARQLREHLQVLAGAIARVLDLLLRVRCRLAQALLAGLETLLDLSTWSCIASAARSE